jgi:integrase
MSRRSYGSGRIYVYTDKQDRETFYGTWYANGRRVNRRLGPKRTNTDPGLTVTQAETELRRQMREIQPSAALNERLGVGQVAEDYVREAKRRGRKPSTCANIQSETRIHLEPFFRGKSIDAISESDVDDFLSILEEKELAPKTIRNIAATLSALCNFAKRRGWATDNPCEAVEPPAVPKATEIRFLTLEEVDAMIAHLPKGIFCEIEKAILLTAALTGLRKGELVALRWRDVDWPAQRIRVPRNYTRGAYGTPKSGRSRSVPMIDEIGGELDRLHQRSGWKRDDDLVFAHPATGRVLPKANIARRMKAALEAAGLDRTHRFHDLRHTFGTRAAAMGVPLRTLQEWMGHADIQTTMIYADYAPNPHEAEMLAQAFERHRSIRRSIPQEPTSTQEHPSAGNMGL